jgi:hypothetical protein
VTQGALANIPALPTTNSAVPKLFCKNGKALRNPAEQGLKKINVALEATCWFLDIALEPQ